MSLTWSRHKKVERLIERKCRYFCSNLFKICNISPCFEAVMMESLSCMRYSECFFLCVAVCLSVLHKLLLANAMGYSFCCLVSHLEDDSCLLLLVAILLPDLSWMHQFQDAVSLLNHRISCMHLLMSILVLLNWFWYVLFHV